MSKLEQSCRTLNRLTRDPNIYIRAECESPEPPAYNATPRARIKLRLCFGTKQGLQLSHPMSF